MKLKVGDMEGSYKAFKEFKKEHPTYDTITSDYFIIDKTMKRIQRKRTKGFKLPPNTICVSRPSKFSNPFKISDGYTKWECVKNFKECVKYPHMAYYYFDEIQASEVFEHFQYISSNIEELRKYDYIACYCSLDEPCHADILIEMLKNK